MRQKRTGNIDPPVRLLHTAINATLRGLSDVAIACKKGCSHCCHTWVSVAAPEALYVAKIVQSRDDVAIEKVRSAHASTKEYDFETRAVHPYPCPLLEDVVCSIYDFRPKVCRLAASADAEICARTYHNITNENVPTPMMHLVGRSAYAMVMAAGCGARASRMLHMSSMGRSHARWNRTKRNSGGWQEKISSRMSIAIRKTPFPIRKHNCSIVTPSPVRQET